MTRSSNLERLSTVARVMSAPRFRAIGIIGCGDGDEAAAYFDSKSDGSSDKVLHLFDIDPVKITACRTRFASLRRSVVIHEVDIFRSIYKVSKTRFNLMVASDILDYYPMNKSKLLVQKLWANLTPRGVLFLSNRIENCSEDGIFGKSHHDLANLTNSLPNKSHIKFDQDSDQTMHFLTVFRR